MTTEQHGPTEPDVSSAGTMRCVDCGRFMACTDPDARHDFEPDNHFGPERNEWTCGPCMRERKSAPPYSISLID